MMGITIKKDDISFYILTLRCNNYYSKFNLLLLTYYLRILLNLK